MRVKKCFEIFMILKSYTKFCRHKMEKFKINAYHDFAISSLLSNSKTCHFNYFLRNNKSILRILIIILVIIPRVVDDPSNGGR